MNDLHIWLAQTPLNVEEEVWLDSTEDPKDRPSLVATSASFLGVVLS